MANHDSEIMGKEVMLPAMSANGEASHSIVPAPPMASPMAPPLGGFLPRGPEILNGPFNQMWLINCLRRKWLPALLLGLLAAGASALLLLVLFPVSSEVTALLELKPEQEEVLGKGNQASRVEFERFQQSQLTLFRSQFVLKSALTPREISELNTVVEKGEDALTWLTDELGVSFPGNGEILEIRYAGEENPEEMEKIINAIIEAYKQEVLVKEKVRRATIRDMLSDLHKETTEDLRGKIERYETLAKEMGGGEDPLSTQMLAMLMRKVTTIQTQINNARDELVELEVNRRLAEQQTKSPTAIERAVTEALNQDPTMAGYEEEKYTLSQYIRKLRSITKRGTSADIKKMEREYQQLLQEQAQYQRQAEAEIREELKSAPNEILQQVTTEYVLRKKSVDAKIVEMEEQLNETMSEIEQKGERSASLTMLESDIEQLREVENEMALKLRSEDVESQTALERVTVMQPARTKEKINEFERFAIACLGGIAAFCATCYGVALIEFRRRRLNGAADVDEGLGIRVLGVLPSVSSRRAMAPGSPIAAQLSESIDNVRATLMHDSTSRPRQVVLVTSASSMEGCTTVSSHLALSLTRAGRRTLLIDGDLREPSLHKLFGMPLEDGLSELLRAEIEVSDALRPTNTEGLWLLTAGQCDMDAVHALAADQLQPIFEKLRAEFDFIVIDGAPVLSLSDSLSIGQHVDGAILTVLRDHSEIRRIYQASELLKSMGIRVIGSVVNGVTTKADRRVARLHRLEAQQRRKLPTETKS